nr:hypothetical protein [Tanacetum cinerariifolium]
MMSFLTAVVTSRYPPTNNQLRSSSNPCQQATINNGRVTVQPIHGRQNYMAAGMSRQYTSGSSENNLGKQMAIVCYNCKGEGHMLKQCTKPKKKRDEKLKAHSMSLPTMPLIKPLSHYGSDNLTEVHNPDNVTNNVIDQDVQAMLISKQSNIMNQSETEITSDSNIILYSRYVNESQYATVQNLSFPTQQDDLILSSLEIDNLKHTLSEHLKEKESLQQMVTLLKNDFQNEELRNIDRELALEKQVKELNNIVFKRKQSAQTVHMLTKPQFFYDHSTRQALGFKNPCYLKKAQQLELKLYDDYAALNQLLQDFETQFEPHTELSAEQVFWSQNSEEQKSFFKTHHSRDESRSKMIQKQKDPMMFEYKVNTKPVDYAALNQLLQDFETRFEPHTELSAEQVFWSQNSEEQKSFFKTHHSRGIKPYTWLKSSRSVQIGIYKWELHAPKRDLRLIDEHFESESVDVSTVSSSDGKNVKTVDVKGMFSKEEPKHVKKNSFSPPIIEDWVSKSEERDEPKFQKQVQPSFPKIEFVKRKDQNQSFRKPVK